MGVAAEGTESTDLTESTERISTAVLLDAISDPRITARTLEYWRQEGLLPKAQRTGQAGKRPEWTYPASAAGQLQELLRLRERNRQPDVLRVALWFRGYDVDTQRVRMSIIVTLQRMYELMIKEIKKRHDPSLPAGDAQWAALEQVATAIARKRGAHAAPRFGRQAQQERDRATTLLLGLGLGFPEASERLSSDAPFVERLMGLDRARRPRGGLGAWLTGAPGDGLEGFASIGSLPALIGAVEAADQSALLSSRELARTMLDGLAAFSRMADAFALADNATGLGMWKSAADDPMAAVWVTALVVAIRQVAGYRDNLHGVVDALDGNVLPSEAHARSLADLAPDELDQRLGGLPFIEQAKIRALIASYRE
jgi:DNA-binding transcriptional MerR regulator